MYYRCIIALGCDVRSCICIAVRVTDGGGQPLVSPAEVAILESMMEGGQSLSLKAHFLSSLPSLSPLSRTLAHLNLSFNNLSVSIQYYTWALVYTMVLCTTLVDYRAVEPLSCAVNNYSSMQERRSIDIARYERSVKICNIPCEGDRLPTSVRKSSLCVFCTLTPIELVAVNPCTVTCTLTSRCFPAS